MIDIVAASGEISPVLIGLGFVGIVVAIIALQKLAGKAASGVVRGVAHGRHKQGQALVREALELLFPVPPAEAAAAVLTTVNAYPSAPVLVPGLYLGEHTPDRLRFVFGSKVDTSFAVDVLLAALPNATAGQFVVVSWTESGGLVAHRDELLRVRDRVSAAATQLGGHVAQSTDSSDH